MRLLTIAVVLVLAIAGASCGGDDESSGDTDDVTIETTTETTTDETTEETTTDETTTAETDDGDSGAAFASGECQELISASSALGQAFSSAGSGTDFDDAGESFADAVDDAPEEIRADLEIIADAYSEYLDVLRDAGLEAGETPSTEQALELSQALASIDFAEYSAAVQRFSAWATANCS